MTEVLEKVRKRASWILEQKYFFSLYLPNQIDRKYISGETHSYLGKKYRLKIYKSDDEYVSLMRGLIQTYVKDRHDTDTIKKVLEKWYKQHAQIKFAERLEICFKRVQKFGIKRPKIQIRKMNKRWGSCSKNGSLILNFHLIKAPSHCIDYVIMHELCHLNYFNHSKAFYKLLIRVMPDWEKRKKRLEHVLI